MTAARARFANCDMTYADLSHADLDAADLTGATLFRANLHAIRDVDARIPDRRAALPPDKDRTEAEQWRQRFVPG
nr:pentapeptide repeat-containing protein [Neoroseomonas marina]